MFAPVGSFDPSVQSHDFEPGIAPSGLFWTIPIAPSAIDVDPGRGQARFHATNVPIGDYHDFFTAIKPGTTPTPSHVSFDVRWPGDGDRRQFRDETFRFTGQYVTSATTISFTASNDGTGVTYFSDPDGQYNPGAGDPSGLGSPAVGHERNGRFFS